MSNDAKLWAVRAGIAACVVLDLYLIGKIQTGEPGKWFALLVVSVIVSLPLFILYPYFRERRWSHDDANLKISTETLANWAKKQRDEKRSQK